ncbi:MAG: SRPBCC family protein [Solirubrobacterales bacterium]|nr:SRPBCC family protein [Solirubrobacterales bacterium]HMT05482.1 SRPBCC family protein [Solirubrobacterales bacterium]
MSELNELHKTVVTTPSATEIRTERVFDAPPDLVFDCFSDPDTLGEWLGPDGYEMQVEEYDFRPGGNYRYINTDPDGTDYTFFGEFLEIDRPGQLIQTFNFVMEPQPPPSIDRADFIGIEENRTRLVTLTTFESQEYRDGMLQAGMEKGMNEGYNKLDRILSARKG